MPFFFYLAWNLSTLLNILVVFHWGRSQYFGYLMRRADSLEKTLVLGKIEGKRRSGRQRMRWLDGITDLMDVNLSKLWKLAEEREAWHAPVHEVTKSETTRSRTTSCLSLSLLSFIVWICRFLSIYLLIVIWIIYIFWLFSGSASWVTIHPCL